MKTYTFHSSKGDLQLRIVGFAEPNNGRMLSKVSLYLNDQDLTKQYFGDWNYINYGLMGYSPVSKDNRWIYIPKEDNHFLIDAQSLAKENLPVLLTSAQSYVSNLFTDRYLVVIGDYVVIIKDLVTNQIRCHKQPNNTSFFRRAAILSATQIKVDLSDDTSQVIDLESCFN